MTHQAELEDWARAVAAAPALDAAGQRIAAEAYRLLALGEPVSMTELAERTGAAAERVAERLLGWPLVFWDDQDRLVGFWGLAIDRLEPTHTLAVGGRTVYGWCAWDTLFIADILRLPTRISSVDPQDGTGIELAVGPHGVTDLRPPEAVLSLMLPDGCCGADTIQRFCHRSHFFSSADSAQTWIGDRPDMFVVSVDEGFHLGRLANRLRLSRRHRSDELAGEACVGC